MPSELLDRVEKWAAETPTKTMLSFADDKGTVTASLTCAELNRRVQNLAWLLVASTAQQSKGFVQNTKISAMKEKLLLSNATQWPEDLSWIVTDDLPTYGLAEHTVYVCGGGKQRLWVDKEALEYDGVFRVVEKTMASEIGKEMVGCGVPSRKDYGIDVRIVDAETGEEKPDGETGEIWISSPSKAQGYYGDEMSEISAEAFQAKVASDTEGKIAIAREHGVKVTLVVLLAPRAIPKTTSGKISRSRCKKALEEKTLEELYRNEDIIADVPAEDDGRDEAVAGGESMDRSVNGPRLVTSGGGAAKSNLPLVITGVPSDEVHTFLVNELAHAVGVEAAQINDNTPLQELGLDSMALTQLQGVIAQKYQVHVEEELLYSESTTLASLHAGLCGDASGNRTGASSAGAPKQKLFCGCIAC
ncbi:hypothetical protein DD238_002464 [Peronospora effusa]|uniref:Carrier domain-containing protein n=1 Tax=Peronospora effusa TaxID=542832 RepID=A0A3M6VRC2_9STRA|nr:hypothetical protein DD238_002464 [Peronospora effusa]RQM10207.1 hypothetical protein DD237_003190 [Peronospora effusa]